MKRENILSMDIEKEKYQKLLHKHSYLEEDFSNLKMTFEAKEQECLTLQSHNQIQNQ